MIAYIDLLMGPYATGAILSAMGGEVLLGMVAVAVLPKPGPERFGTFVLLIVAMRGSKPTPLAQSRCDPGKSVPIIRSRQTSGPLYVGRDDLGGG